MTEASNENGLDKLTTRCTSKSFRYLTRTPVQSAASGLRKPDSRCGID